MRITYKGDYALKTILKLAENYGNNPVTIHELARQSDIPIKFLEQILLDLKKGGFVESRRGKIGGYLLSRNPSQIKLGEVIKFMDGQIGPIACVNSNYKGCNDINKCVFREIWKQIAQATSQVINNVTFEDLVRKNKDLASALVYQI